MKIRSILIAAAAGLVIAPANALLIDLSGEEANGFAFNVFTVANADANAVIDVDFNFVYEAGGDNHPGSASWGSELLIQLTHVDTGEFLQWGTQSGSCDAFSTLCNFDLMWDEGPGTYTASGTLTFGAPIGDGSGDWEILIADSFDDPAFGGPDDEDGVFLDGSFIEINQETPVPLPATLLLVGVGLVGMGFARRRC